MSFFNGGYKVVKVMEIVVMRLEDDENMNTGYGSNLTTDGVVKFDITN